MRGRLLAARWRGRRGLLWQGLYPLSDVNLTHREVGDNDFGGYAGHEGLPRGLRLARRCQSRWHNQRSRC